MKKQEFVTLYGKVVVEKNTLFIRNYQVPFTQTNLFRIGFELCFVAGFVISFFMQDRPRSLVNIVLWSGLLPTRFRSWYDLLFKRSYAERIPLNKIKSVTIEKDMVGLNIFVHFQLANGPYKRIPFRVLENQYESLIEIISLQTAPIQIA